MINSASSRWPIAIDREEKIDKEFKRFLYVVLGPLSELYIRLNISNVKGYTKETQFSQLIEKNNIVTKKMIYKITRRLSD